MHIRFTVLDQEEQHLIHGAALRLLDNIGLRVHHDGLRAMLLRAGCREAAVGDRIQFPPGIVTDGLAAAPRRWDMAGVLGARMSLPTEDPHFVARLLLPRVLDYGRTEPRAPRQQDIVNLCRLTDSLPGATFVLKTDCTCSDLPPETNYLHSIAAVYTNTTRIVVANPIHSTATRYWVELGEAATGRPVEEHPIVRCGIPVTSPFQLDAESAESLVYLARKHAPITCMAMPIAGVSAPLTVAGAVAQHTAEVLALVVAAQIVRPGTPVWFAGVPCTVNMTTGGIIMASPALPLFNGALTTMARYYGLPFHTGGTYTDARVSDVQCGVEKALSVFVRMAAGGDASMLGGDLEDAQVVSYEQLLIDYDVWEAACQVLRGIAVTPDTLATEIIERATGAGGEFLTDPHTLAHLRGDEQFQGRLWRRGDSPDSRPGMWERAHDRVEQILLRPWTTSVPADACERVDAYVRREAARIRAGQKTGGVATLLA